VTSDAATTADAGPALAVVRRRALGVALLAALPLLVGLVLDPRRALQSWHVAAVFWVCVAGGCLVLMLLGHLTGGAWARAPRRLHEAAATSWPWLALALAPTLLATPTCCTAAARSG